MSTVIGIDLGTTQSCVAIPARPGVAGDSPVEIIRDRYSSKTTPSVVVEDSSGNIIVGDLAKKRAGYRPKPIFFIKRYMGTDYTHKLRGRDCKPEEISKEILKYLKKIAEEYLKEPVDKAVICVPAYFDLNAKKATTKAGELAGLEVMETLSEPIAAALAYCLQEQRKNLKIFCFDMGGGTFDATVMEKRDGDINVLAFGGDPYLGGYDFDKLLANHIIEKLKKQGYQLDLDVQGNDDDDAKYQRLLMIAEKYKYRLSEKDCFETPVWEREVFEDQAGKTINIDMIITREEFEQLIKGERDREIEEMLEKRELTPVQLEDLEHDIQAKPASVRKSIYLTQVVLQKAKLFQEEIDEVIMVGGSSYIPLVQRELKLIFDREPMLINPDAIVAEGAALKAKDYMQGLPDGLCLENPSTQTSKISLPVITIRGQLEQEKFKVALSETRVRLLRQPDYERSVTPDSATGKFIFENTELLEGAENQFELAVCDTRGAILCSYSFQVICGEDDDGPKEQLTKPICIETVDGLEQLFAVGEYIPCEGMIITETNSQSGKIVVPIYEGDQMRAKILIEGISPSLPIGTPVETTISIDKKLNLHGIGRVPADDNREGRVSATLENEVLPPINVLREQFSELRDRFEEALDKNQDKNKKLRHTKSGRGLMEEIEKELKSVQPNLPKIAHMLSSLKTKIKDLGLGPVILWPLREKFDERVAQACSGQKELTRLDSNFKDKYTKDIEAHEEEGRAAYENRDQHNWQFIYKRLEKILEQIANDFFKIKGVPPEDVLAVWMKTGLIENILALSKDHQARCEHDPYYRANSGNKNSKKIDELLKEVELVDVDSNFSAAIKKLGDIHEKKYKPLAEEITGTYLKIPDNDGLTITQRKRDKGA